jgi:hypothetical protein
MSLYPRTQGNTALADNVVHMLDQVLSPQTTEDLDYIDERTHRPG